MHHVLDRPSLFHVSKDFAISNIFRKNVRLCVISNLFRSTQFARGFIYKDDILMWNLGRVGVTYKC